MKVLFRGNEYEEKKDPKPGDIIKIIRRRTFGQDSYTVIWPSESSIYFNNIVAYALYHSPSRVGKSSFGFYSINYDSFRDIIVKPRISDIIEFSEHLKFHKMQYRRRSRKLYKVVKKGLCIETSI